MSRGFINRDHGEPQFGEKLEEISIESQVGFYSFTTLTDGWLPDRNSPSQIDEFCIQAREHCNVLAATDLDSFKQIVQAHLK